MNKLMCFVVFCGLAASCGTVELDMRNGFAGYSSANMNKYVDDIIRHVGPFVIDYNLDPLKIANIDANFTFTFILDYHGQIHLHNGWLQGLSTVKRSGNCQLSYDHKLLKFDIDLEVDLLVNFDYSGKFIGIGADGQLTGYISKQRIVLGLLIDTELLTFSLQDFHLDNQGKLDLHITGLGLLGLADAIVNALIDAITFLFKGTIMSSVEGQVRTVVENILMSIPPLLPPLPDNPDHPLTCLSVLAKH